MHEIMGAQSLVPLPGIAHVCLKSPEVWGKKGSRSGLTGFPMELEGPMEEIEEKRGGE